MLPKLVHIFKFLHNFSVYCCLFLSFVILSKANESICMRQYFDLRYKAYKNAFGNNECDIDVRLSEMNYFRHRSWNDGTLLHIYSNYRQFDTMLERDGFNVDTPNTHIGTSKFTPFSVTGYKSDSIIYWINN